MDFPSPLRYPGGKTLLASELEKIMVSNKLDKPVYVEPYAGGAGAALSLLFSKKVKQVIINDLDDSIYAFWKSASQESEKFARSVISIPVTIKEWKRQKKIYADTHAPIFLRGFATFFLNRTNVSGILNANPIGGIKQDGNFKIDARFNKVKLAERIRKIGIYRNRIRVTHQDGLATLKKYAKEENTLIYLDPPYFKKGSMLYMNHYGQNDHEELARILNKQTKVRWILTYDDTEKIKELYRKRRKRRLSLHYRVRDSRRARELMIFSDAFLNCS